MIYFGDSYLDQNATQFANLNGKFTLLKIPKFHLISWCANFVKTNCFRGVSGDSLETWCKRYASTKFPH